MRSKLEGLTLAVVQNPRRNKMAIDIIDKFRYCRATVSLRGPVVQAHTLPQATTVNNPVAHHRLMENRACLSPFLVFYNVCKRSG